MPAATARRIAKETTPHKQRDILKRVPDDLLWPLRLSAKGYDFGEELLWQKIAGGQQLHLLHQRVKEKAPDVCKSVLPEFLSCVPSQCASLAKYSSPSACAYDAESCAHAFTSACGVQNASSVFQQVGRTIAEVHELDFFWSDAVSSQPVAPISMWATEEGLINGTTRKAFNWALICAKSSCQEESQYATVMECVVELDCIEDGISALFPVVAKEYLKTLVQLLPLEDENVKEEGTTHIDATGEKTEEQNVEALLFPGYFSRARNFSVCDYVPGKTLSEPLRLLIEMSLLPLLVNAGMSLWKCAWLGCAPELMKLFYLLKGVWRTLSSFLDAVEAGILYLQRRVSATDAVSLAPPDAGPVKFAVKALMLNTLEAHLKFVRFARAEGIRKASAAVMLVSHTQWSRVAGLASKLLGIANKLTTFMKLLDPLEVGMAGGCYAMEKLLPRGPQLRDPVLWAELGLAGLNAGCAKGGTAAVAAVLSKLGFPVVMFQITRSLCSNRRQWQFKMSDIISENEMDEIAVHVADIVFSANKELAAKAGPQILSPFEAMHRHWRTAGDMTAFTVVADKFARKFNADHPMADLSGAEEAVEHMGNLFLSFLNSH